MTAPIPPGKPVKDLAMLRQMESQMQELAREIAARVPPRWGFCLLVYEFDGGGLAWVSDSVRADAIQAMREALDRLERGETGRYEPHDG